MNDHRYSHGGIRVGRRQGSREPQEAPGWLSGGGNDVPLGVTVSNVTQNAFKSKATRTHGLEMFSASDEDDIDANRGQPRTEVSADTASTKDGNAHGNFLALQSSSTERLTLKSQLGRSLAFPRITAGSPPPAVSREPHAAPSFCSPGVGRGSSAGARCSAARPCPGQPVQC